MSIYQRVKAHLINNKQVRHQGGYNCIPWSRLSRLSKVVPGIEKRKIYLVTASSKVGKSKLAEYMFIYEPLRFIKKHRPANIKLKVLYFSLEQSKEEKILEALSNRLFESTKQVISPTKLQSVFDNYILDDATAQLLSSFDQEFQDFESIVTYIDDIRHPTGIFMYCEDYFKKNGTIHTRKLKIDNVEQDVFDWYEPNDPDLYTIIIVDHLSLLTPEKDQSLHHSMSKWSSTYAIRLRDRYNATIVNVQQQAMDVEKQQFNQVTGKSIIEKLKPSQDGLGDNKLTARDCNVMFGLFAPHRYGVKEYEGYNLERLEENYRELSVILNRSGSASCTTDLYFNGAINYFKELPLVMGEPEYQDIEKIRQNQV